MYAIVRLMLFIHRVSAPSPPPSPHLMYATVRLMLLTHKVSAKPTDLSPFPCCFPWRSSVMMPPRGPARYCSRRQSSEVKRLRASESPMMAMCWPAEQNRQSSEVKRLRARESPMMAMCWPTRQ